MSDITKTTFTIATPLGDYTDALTLTAEQVATLTYEDIAAMQQVRADNWVAAVVVMSLDDGGAE